MTRPAAPPADTLGMTCPLLTELDAWFSLAVALLGQQPAVLRDVLLVVGGPVGPSDAASVTAADCVDADGYVIVYPPTLPGVSLPLTPDFAEATGLYPSAWPLRRHAPAADAVAIERAIAAVDAAYARRYASDRPTGSARLVALRMHAWEHELGGNVTVLARFYGSRLPSLVAGALTCAGHLVPAQRGVPAYAR